MWQGGPTEPTYPMEWIPKPPCPLMKTSKARKIHLMTTGIILATATPSIRRKSRIRLCKFVSFGCHSVIKHRTLFNFFKFNNSKFLKKNDNFDFVNVCYQTSWINIFWINYRSQTKIITTTLIVKNVSKVLINIQIIKKTEWHQNYGNLIWHI